MNNIIYFERIPLSQNIEYRVCKEIALWVHDALPIIITLIANSRGSGKGEEEGLYDPLKGLPIEHFDNDKDIALIKVLHKYIKILHNHIQWFLEVTWIQQIVDKQRATSNYQIKWHTRCQYKP